MEAERDTSETAPLLNPTKDGSVSGQSDSDGTETLAASNQFDDLRNSEEQRVVDDSGAAQLKGIPDARKKLEYILPALSIGVRRLNEPTAFRSQLNDLIDISFCRRSNPDCVELWTHRKRSQGSELDQLDRHLIFPYPNLLPTTLWQAQRYFWSEGMLVICLCCFRAWLLVLWPCSRHPAANSSESQSLPSLISLLALFT